MPFVSMPPMRTEPAVGRSKPARIRRSDDFPEPDGPTSAVTAASRISTSTPFSAVTSPAEPAYTFTTPVQAAAIVSTSLIEPKHRPDVRMLGPVLDPPTADGGAQRDRHRDREQQRDRHLQGRVRRQVR